VNRRVAISVLAHGASVAPNGLILYRATVGLQIPAHGPIPAAGAFREKYNRGTSR